MWNLDLEAGTAVAADTGTVAGLENVVGTPFDDRIRGDGEANRIDAGKGVDERDGRAGDDVLYSGSDVNQDFLAGGVGTDTVDYSTSPRRVIADLQAGTSEGSGNDLLISVENILGSVFGDDLWGDDLTNVIVGAEGDDVIDLRGGDDTVDGGLGTDIADEGTAPTAVRWSSPTPASRPASWGAARRLSLESSGSHGGRPPGRCAHRPGAVRGGRSPGRPSAQPRRAPPPRRRPSPLPLPRSRPFRSSRHRVLTVRAAA